MGCSADVRSAIMIQHGTSDDIVDISSRQERRDFWVGQNGCSQETTPSYSGRESYTDCPEDAPVHWCTGSYNHYIDSTAVGNIWEVFSGL